MQPVKFVVISCFEKYVGTNKNKQSWLLQLQVKLCNVFKRGSNDHLNLYIMGSMSRNNYVQ